jgi:hypothetical protein
MVHSETEERLDFHGIAEIEAAAGIFMTLHSGPGTHEEDFHQAIKAGMTGMCVSIPKSDVAYMAAAAARQPKRPALVDEH